MKNVTLEAMIIEVLELLRETNLSPKCLKDYKYCGFGEIVKCFSAQGCMYYNDATMQAYMENIRALYKRGEISRWKWQQLRKTSAWLKEYHATGAITLGPLAKWEVLHNPLRQRPSEEQQQDSNNLFALVYQTKQELSKFGLSAKSLQNYTYDGFDAILRYCIRHDETSYSKTRLEAFVAEARSAFEKQEMCRSTYQNARKAAALLEEYHKNGRLEWHYLSAWNTRKLTQHFSSALGNYCETNRHDHSLSEGTIATNKSAIRGFLFCVEDMGICDITEVTRQTVNDCITILAPRYTHGMKSCIPAIRSFLAFLHDNNLTAEALQNAIPETAAPRRAIRYGFTQEETDALLSSADRTSMIGKRDYAMMLLAVQTGLRVVDISNLIFQNINWRELELHLIQHKTGKPLSLPIEPEVGNALVDYILNGRPQCDLPFVFLTKDPPYRKLHNRSASSIVSRYMKKCGIDCEKIPRRGFHSFRRSFGSRLLQSQVPLEMLSEILGHSSIDSSKPYVAADEVGLRSCAIGLSGIEVKAGELQW